MDYYDITSKAASVVGFLTVLWGFVMAIRKFLQPVLDSWLPPRLSRRLGKLETRFDRAHVDIQRLLGKVNLNIKLRGDAIYICDAEGGNVWVSEALSQMFGMAPGEMAGNGWSKAIIHEDMTKNIELWRYCVKNKLDYVTEYAIEVKGELKYIWTTASPCLGEFGELLFYCGYTVDITDAHRDRHNLDNQTHRDNQNSRNNH